MQTPPLLTILMPVYNEAKTILEIIRRVEAANIGDLNKELIIVDDFSQDGTREALKQLAEEGKYKIYFHSHNMGKGAALRTALTYASGDIIIIQDADLEYDPNEYAELLVPVLEGRADVVYGSRLSGGKTVRAFNYFHYLGNKFLTFLTNILYNTILTDMEEMVFSYLGAITLINVLLGVCVAVAMYLLGMSTPLLWGAMACMLNFVPYVGPMLCLIILSLVSLVTFDDLPQAILPPLVFIGLIAVESNFITPLALGRRLAMNPLVIFIWLLERALNSPWGRMMRAIRDNEVSAAAMGKDVTRQHLLIFILGSAVIGVAGAMLTSMETQLVPGAYSPLRFTFLIWIMVIVGGSGNNWGAVLGGLLVGWLWLIVDNAGPAMVGVLTAGMADGPLKSHFIDMAPQMRLLTLGVALLLVLRFSPRGLLPEK